MAAYVIVDIRVNDLVRGAAVETLEGGRWKPGRFLILEFPSAQRARDSWGSEPYAPIKKIRQEDPARRSGKKIRQEDPARRSGTRRPRPR